MVKTFVKTIGVMIDTTRFVAGILHTAGTISARRAETELSLHLTELRRQHTEVDEAVSRINCNPRTLPEIAS